MQHSSVYPLVEKLIVYEQWKVEGDDVPSLNEAADEEVAAVGAVGTRLGGRCGDERWQ